MLKKKFDAVVNENVGLRKEAEDKNNIVDDLEDKIMNFNQRINVKEKEQSKCCVPKAAWETKIKEIRKNHMEEVHELQEQVTKLNKVSKAKDKVEKDLSNARETTKTLKAENCY